MSDTRVQRTFQEKVDPFFIVGCPRSGTTLLRWMLDHHPKMAVAPETHFGARYVRKRGRFGAEGLPTTRTALLDDFCRTQGFLQMSLDESVFRSRAGADPLDDWLPLRTALQDFAQVRNVSLVGEKTPSHALYLASIADAFPSAKFILLRRDPRAVVASWQSASWANQTDAEVAEIWRCYSRAMRVAMRELTGRCLPVDYEELVTNPVRVLQSICGFLGTEFDSRMLSYSDRERTTSTPAENRDNELTYKAPVASRIDAWRGSMPRGSLRRIEAICGDEMAICGHRRETSRGDRLLVTPAVLPVVWRNRWRKQIKRSLRRQRPPTG
jgi:hypothetical protein